MALPETASNRASSYLLLDVAGQTCALPREAVREVLPLPDLFQPPSGGSWLAGFLNLGGNPVPVIDLARLFGLRAGRADPGLYAHLVLAADGSRALLVDRASDLVGVPAEAVRAVEPGQTLNGCVEAEITVRGRLVHALSLARILTEEEGGRVEALAVAARARLADLPAA
ncbi:MULTISPECIES: chemotaxis protein CheW [Methylobacterium]|uniref:chemotaxis protein CheW n=1 Tax=Methylobacterium TaxID=407 RepID=UPI001FDF8D32|nr:MULTISPECIES: chemotaxis protein CheW [Methylobacterium]MDR7037558.1 purine-binding chemotaxis protein CheW [Methylobacterium sp. BE186]